MRFIAIIFIALILLTGCSDKRPPLELTSVTVEIGYDKCGGIEIMAGEKKGKIIEPVSLSYDFVLKNSSRKTLGGINKPTNKRTFEFEDGIKVVIEPNEKLKTVAKGVMGFNIFDEEERRQACLGVGGFSAPVLRPGDEVSYSLDFVLGALEENREIRLAPSQEQLDKLKDNALDATLVVSIEGKEISRFDLNNSTN